MTSTAVFLFSIVFIWTILAFVINRNRTKKDSEQKQKMAKALEDKRRADNKEHSRRMEEWHQRESARRLPFDAATEKFVQSRYQPVPFTSIKPDNLIRLVSKNIGSHPYLNKMDLIDDRWLIVLTLSPFEDCHLGAWIVFDLLENRDPLIEKFENSAVYINWIDVLPGGHLHFTRESTNNNNYYCSLYDLNNWTSFERNVYYGFLKYEMEFSKENGVRRIISFKSTSDDESLDSNLGPGDYVVTKSENGWMDISTNQPDVPPFRLHAHQTDINIIQYSANGSFFFTASIDGEIKLWYVQ
ncbi:WD40 repeat domain-containing protein [Candidatus Villigracilis saccharophilus]|uniref:WD40 repeat domain-containing protein n=1 Tax=Candidatus Villigracilis saccharophilus TaxID=3140684 RepID=UPI0031366BA4|nr:hypothetical protein [Anaerolineales bacterium]